MTPGFRPAMARLLHDAADRVDDRDDSPPVYYPTRLPELNPDDHTGGHLARLGDLCRDLGMTPAQAGQLFGALPAGAQRACWDDLRRRVERQRAGP